jgi:hypothetical protein
MAITQFLFMGLILYAPKRFGVVGSREQFESFNHFWRLIAHLLGTQDQYNCCGETLEVTESRLKAIVEDVFRPEMSKPNDNYEQYLRMIYDGMWCTDMTMNFGKTLKKYYQVSVITSISLQNLRFST